MTSTVSGWFKVWSNDTHNNMEIISIPLQRNLEHKEVWKYLLFKEGDVQAWVARNGCFP